MRAQPGRHQQRPACIRCVWVLFGLECSRVTWLDVRLGAVWSCMLACAVAFPSKLDTALISYL